MSTKYIIQSLQNQNYCIGVRQASANQPLVLSYLQGAGSPLSQWYMDPNTGIITLVADPRLCIDVQGVVIQGSQLILSPYVPGRQSQNWNWLGNPPFISNNSAGNMVIDNSGGSITPGNPILVWSQNGGNNQKWTELSVAGVEAFQAQMKGEGSGAHPPSVSPAS